jgi:hypothetical protein
MTLALATVDTIDLARARLLAVMPIVTTSTRTEMSAVMTAAGTLAAIAPCLPVPIEADLLAETPLAVVKGEAAVTMIPKPSK